MRPIDAEPIERALFKLADKSLAKNPYENARICAFRRAFELILNAPTITPPSNAPLDVINALTGVMELPPPEEAAVPAPKPDAQRELDKLRA